MHENLSCVNNCNALAKTEKFTHEWAPELKLGHDLHSVTWAF